MKKLFVLITIFFCLCIIPNAFANFDGFDNFDGDKSKWNTSWIAFGAVLDIDSGNDWVYFDSNTAGFNNAAWQFTNGEGQTGDNDNDWTLTLAVNVVDPGLSVADQSVQFGLHVTNPVDNADCASVTLKLSHDGTTLSKNWDSRIYTSAGGDWHDTAITSDTSGHVRIVYTAGTTSIATQYSENSGDTWSTLKTYDTNVGWESPSAFKGGILGSSIGIAIDPEDNVYADSFSAVPEPSTYALFGIGLLGLIGGWMRKQRRKL
ncbi:MAG: PEP-CTERM sorting domain-containing protein [Candidatus Ancaeobacter aquaticus]|nr:PEP-CTERM sorting domain-containing protein [Candidatus Ancaeobacter aquaticus]